MGSEIAFQAMSPASFGLHKDSWPACNQSPLKPDSSILLGQQMETSRFGYQNLVPWLRILHSYVEIIRWIFGRREILVICATLAPDYMQKQYHSETDLTFLWFGGFRWTHRSQCCMLSVWSGQRLQSGPERRDAFSLVCTYVNHTPFKPLLLTAKQW